MIPGTEGSEEGPSPCAPQVRAASGPPHRESLGSSLQSQWAALPGRALASGAARRAGPVSSLLDAIEKTYCLCHTSQSHSKSKLLRPRSVGNNARPPQLEIRSSNNGGFSGPAGQARGWGSWWRCHHLVTSPAQPWVRQNQSYREAVTLAVVFLHPVDPVFLWSRNSVVIPTMFQIKGTC